MSVVLAVCAVVATGVWCVVGLAVVSLASAMSMAAHNHGVSVQDQHNALVMEMQAMAMERDENDGGA